MNKNLIKVLAIVLMFAIIVPFAVSCQDNTADPGKTNPGKTDTGTEDDSRIKPDIPAGVSYIENGQPYNYRILSFDMAHEWSVKDMYAEELNEDPINDSVFNRNKAVEELLGIEITEFAASDAYDLARKSISSDLDEYDLIVIPSANQMALAQNEYLYPLEDLDYLDPTKPWWDNNAYEALSVAGAHFLIVGDMQIMDKDATFVQFFNKKMIEDYNLEDPFALVESGDWTIEKQIEMVKKVTDDTTGEGNLDKEDTWGFVGTPFCPMAFFFGFGEQIVTKNADDIPELTMNTPKMPQIVNYLIELGSSQSKIALRAAAPDVQYVFENNRGLFMGEVLQLAERLREMDTDFGLLPYPKYDKDQKDYYSVVHSTTCMLSVPNTIADPERNSVIMEALCAESKYTLREAYYDKNLETKFLRYDEGSKKMLDIIFGNRVYDLGFINNWGNFYQGFIDLIAAGSTDFASMYSKNESVALQAIDDIVEIYSAI